MDDLRSVVYRLLRASERYFKTDMVYLTKGGGWLGLGHFVSSLSGFLLAIAFANLLPQDIYGTYKFVLSIFGILTVATLPGINTYIVQSIARGKEGTLLPSIAAKIRWGILGSVGALLLAGYYYVNGNVPLSFSFSIVALFVPFLDTFSLYTSYLQSKKLFSEATRHFARNQIISLVVVTGTLFLSDNLFIILLSYFGSLTIVRLWSLLRVLKRFPPNTEKDTASISYGKHLSIISTVGNVAAYVDHLLLFHFIGAVGVAVYAFALAPIEQIRGLFKNIPPLAAPKFAERSIREINVLLGSRLSWLTVIGFFIAILYVLITPYLFRIFFPKYEESILISQALAFLIVLRLPLSLFSSAFQAQMAKIPKSWLYWGVVPHVVLIGGLIILIQLYGIWGAVISRYLFLFTSFSIMVVQWTMLTRREP